MKEIQLTQGKVAIVDDEDYKYLNQWKWHTQESRPGKFYAARNISVNGKKKIELMHRLILKLDTTAIHVDHIDNDGLNNTRKNIRACNNTENQRNRSKSINNKSGFKGVSWHKLQKKYQAHISDNNSRLIYLGRFTCPIEAARAYNAAALIHHGEFARLNEI